MTTIPTPIQVGVIVQFKQDGILLEGRVKSIHGDQIEIDDDTIRPHIRLTFCPGKYDGGRYCGSCWSRDWCKAKKNETRRNDD